MSLLNDTVVPSLSGHLLPCPIIQQDGSVVTMYYADTPSNRHFVRWVAANEPFSKDPL
jgi:hypothetical protein